MATIGIVYHSMYGMTHELAQQIAEGVQEAGHKAELRRVPELMDDAALAQAGAGDAQEAQSTVPLATVAELPEFDGLILGSPTRFGNRTSQMAAFLDQTGGHWAEGRLVGKPAGFFTGAATMHGGHESTILTMSTYAYHMGMVIVPMGYTLDEVGSTTTGGGPYGPTQLSPQGGGKDGLSDDETAIARSYGARFAEIAEKLAA